MTAIVKYQDQGINVELMCKSGMVLGYRNGTIAMDKVIISEDLYKNAKKGDKLSESDRDKVFEGLTEREYLDLILTKGHYPMTTQELRELKKQKTQALVQYIVCTFCNAKEQSYTVSTIESVLKKKNINVDPKKSPVNMFNEIRKKLEGTIVLKPKPGLKQSFKVAYKDYGQVQSALNKYIVDEHHCKGGYAEFEIDVPPTDLERVLPVINKYEYHPED